MDLKALVGQVATGEIDTVVVAFPDVFGRLVGKRFTGKFFLEHVAEPIVVNPDPRLARIAKQRGWRVEAW